MKNQSTPEILGEAPAFLDILSRISAIAPLDRPVLIAGERGSGKELLAARLHFLSTRWKGPFIKVNCAALSEDLLESELFGHEPGAFTGASKRHLGRFERAQTGTLFLDEIASASMRIQEKLLRVIEYGEFERLGGSETLTVDVRVLGAANLDLRHLVAQGKFRHDLLDRLAFEVVTAPPLRARKQDITLLAHHFAGRFMLELNSDGYEASFDGFSSEAIALMKNYDWPGNVRELKNVAERAVFRWVSAGRHGPVGQVVFDPFESEHAPVAGPVSVQEVSKKRIDGKKIMHNIEPSMIFENHSKEFDLRKYVDEIECKMVEQALEVNHWHQGRTAEFLKLTYDQMRGLIRKYDLRKDDKNTI